MLIGVVLACCSAGVVAARDFFELPEIVDPMGIETGNQTGNQTGGRPVDGGGHASPQTVFLPTTVTVLEYNSYSIAGNESNSFDVRLHAGITVYRGHRAAVNVHFGSYLIVGPVAPGDDPASIAEWWMNAVYYSYGAVAGVAFGPGAVVAEYSRYSFHPLRNRLNGEFFNDPAGESIRVGYSFPEYRRRGVVISSLVRFGYLDLFDYWQADIEKPRARWTLRTNVVASYEKTRVTPFIRLNLDARALRVGGFDAVFGGDLGVAAGGAAGRLELYTSVYSTPDTEEIKGRTDPAFLAGFGVRFRGRSAGGTETAFRR